MSSLLWYHSMYLLMFMFSYSSSFMYFYIIVKQYINLKYNNSFSKYIFKLISTNNYFSPLCNVTQDDGGALYTTFAELRK